MTALAKQNMLRMETRAKFPYLIEITRENEEEEIEVYRYANCDEDIEFEDNGETKTFNASYFELKPPARTANKIENGSISISAVDQTWIEKIRTTQKPATIRFLAVIQYNNGSVDSVEAIEDMEFILRNAKWNEVAISFDMIFDEKMEEQIPPDTMTIQKCPIVA